MGAGQNWWQGGLGGQLKVVGKTQTDRLVTDSILQSLICIRPEPAKSRKHTNEHRKRDNPGDQFQVPSGNEDRAHIGASFHVFFRQLRGSLV